MKEQAIIRNARLENVKLLFEVVIWSKNEKERDNFIESLKKQKDCKQTYTMKIDNCVGDMFKTVATYEVPQDKENEILDILMR